MMTETAAKNSDVHCKGSLHGQFQRMGILHPSLHHAYENIPSTWLFVEARIALLKTKVRRGLLLLQWSHQVFQQAIQFGPVLRGHSKLAMPSRKGMLLQCER